MKDAYPVKVAEYAIAKKIVLMPGFQWWVPQDVAEESFQANKQEIQN
jgi:hypothetical protein